MKKIFNKAVLVVTALLVCIMCTTTAQAQDDITILDTSGVVRAQGSLAGATDGEVTMTVIDTNTGMEVPDGTVVTLTPSSGGEPISAVTSGGLVIFTGLPAGSYTVASTSAITFTSVGITTGAAAAAGGIAGGTAAVAGLAGAGGITAVALSNNSDSTPLSPIR